MRSEARSALLTWVLVLVVDLAAFAPRLVWPNPSAGSTLTHPMNRVGYPGIGYEYGLLIAILALAATTRWRRVTAIAATVVFAAFLLFTTYHEAYLWVFYIDPAVVDDYRLLVNLGHFLRDASLGVWALAAAVVVAYVGLIALAALTFRRLQSWARARARSPRRIAVAAAIYAAAGGALVAIPKNPVMQPLSDGITINVAASRAALASRRAIFEHPPDTRYDGFSALPLATTPNVYLLLFEAYGEILATCPTSKGAYRNLLGRLETELTASGFHMRSGYATAPIHGGRSWMSIATIQTGIHIDSQPIHRVFEQNAAQIPSLTSFFKAHGYHTMMLQPWDKVRVGLPAFDLYRRDVAVIHRDLPYRGVRHGLTGIPDQYSLGLFDERYLQSAPSPRFVSYMATSTHYNWWPPPPFAKDWHALDAGPLPADAIVPWPPVAGVEAITNQEYAWYFADVEYEWRALVELMKRHRDESALFVIVGDHQPFLKCGDDPVTLNTPLHVLSTDRGLLDRVADRAGLEAGLYVEPGRHRPLRHEAMFSLLVGALAAEGPSRPALFEEGLPLSSLNR